MIRFQICAALDDYGPMAVSRLAGVLASRGVHPGRTVLSRCLNRMLLEGYLKAFSCYRDKRKRCYRMTEKGIRLLESYYVSVGLK